MDKYRLLTELILLALKRLTPFDFTHYAQPAMEKRLSRFIEHSRFTSAEQILTELINGNDELCSQLVQTLTVTYSRFFRDPAYFSLFFNKIMPQLKAYPRFKIWSIGCASGEEIYSYGVLLKLGRLINRAVLIGTDINTAVLEKAKQGAYPIDTLNSLHDAFRHVGLAKRHSLIDCIDMQESSFTFTADIHHKCHFTAHNMLNNASLGEMQVISCRNVLIYLNEEQQDRIVRELILPSLDRGGFMIFGEAESQHRLIRELNLKQLADGINIYQWSPG